MRMVSEHLSYEEATHSVVAEEMGVVNEPGVIEFQNMRWLALQVYEPVRKVVCKERLLGVVSFYRTEELNRIMGGVASSPHCKGVAMDIDAHVYGNGTNREIFEYIRDWLTFDELIWKGGTKEEPDWVHVSLKSAGNRRQIRGYAGMKNEK